MVHALAVPVVAAGGRFYPAKDAALPADVYRSTFRDGQLERFAELKAQLDPDHILRSGLADRLIYED
jgi:FAD/FMN-containing dehydrogenase